MKQFSELSSGSPAGHPPYRRNVHSRMYNHTTNPDHDNGRNHTADNGSSAEKPKLLIATTTSLYDTGLLDYLEPKFESQYNVDIQITSQGTGKAIEIAKKGDADVLLVHSPSQELAFVKDGFGINRRSFASNYFLVVGPSADPAGIKNMTPEMAFTTLHQKGTNNTAGVFFVSRGDASGTHTAEKAIWSKANFNYTTSVVKSGAWYIEAGKGMGETLQMASEKKAYTFTDEGTYLCVQEQPATRPGDLGRGKPAQHLQCHDRVQ